MERTNFYDAIYSPVVLLLNAAVVGIVMLLSASGNARILSLFGMSVGTSVAVINYISRIFAPIESLGMEIQTIQSAMAGVRRIDAFLAQPERAMENGETAACGDVVLSHVTFGYGEAPVLRDFSMTVKQGEQITLVGRTGAGKSTVFKLLLGLYPPQAGTVTIGGVDASAISDRTRRSCIGCVEQHFSRVPGTVLDQITLGDPQITEEMAKHAARLAGIDAAVQALPEGYHTVCTEGLFSQGEWQLLSIARAAAANPAVLLLDEITANLDAETEQRVLAALRRACEGRTVLSVSHRIYENLGGRTIEIGPSGMLRCPMCKLRLTFIVWLIYISHYKSNSKRRMPLNLKKEADLLEQVLSIAETDYAQAYRFLLDAYEKSPAAYGPQTLYFLACLSGGTGLSEAALGWLKKAVLENGWWYRPEVLIDDDLETLSGNSEFLSLKAVSDARYQKARETSKAVFSRKSKTAANLFLAVHGNTQNADLAREDWAPVLAGSACWQLETVQSAEPDGCSTYRWSYDMASFLPVAGALEALQTEGYETMVCGGFSAGCDMLLRAICFTPARCDVLVLQSPWIPVLQEHSDALVRALREKHIALRIFCGLEDEDCLPLARQLYTAAKDAGLPVTLTTQEHTRHQFPGKPYTLEDILSPERQMCI